MQARCASVDCAPCPLAVQGTASSEGLRKEASGVPPPLNRQPFQCSSPWCLLNFPEEAWEVHGQLRRSANAPVKDDNTRANMSRGVVDEQAFSWMWLAAAKTQGCYGPVAALWWNPACQCHAAAHAVPYQRPHTGAWVNLLVCADGLHRWRGEGVGSNMLHARKSLHATLPLEACKTQHPPSARLLATLLHPRSCPLCAALRFATARVCSRQVRRTSLL